MVSLCHTNSTRLTRVESPGGSTPSHALTLSGGGGVGGVELLEGLPELQPEGLLEEVLGELLLLCQPEVGQPLKVALGRGEKQLVPSVCRQPRLVVAANQF